MSAGCTTMLGIDGDYVSASTTHGGGAGGRHGDGSDASPAGSGAEAGFVNLGGSGGAAGADTGGTGGTGAGSGGAPPPSCSGDAAACLAGRKCCTGACLVPAPLIGCSLDGCAPCPEPPRDGVAVCNGTQCGVLCNPGFVEQAGGLCASAASGGAPGTGGAPSTGGRTSTATGGQPAATCDPKRCAPCVPVGPFGCCKNNGTCGCTWAPGVCY